MAQGDSIDIDLAVDPDLFLDEAAFFRKVAARAGIPVSELGRVEYLRRSIDARRGRVRIRVAVRLHPAGTPPPAALQPLALPSLLGEPRVAIIGAGPAGMFCAWRLAQAGIRSAVFERGRPVRDRRLDVARLTRDGVLDPESNYCFGEGGAGTFSDGKLYTRSSKRGPVRDVLEAFVGYGAATDLLVDARPHIGTNRLPAVVVAMREHLRSAGVEFHFERRVAGLVLRGEAVAGIRLADGSASPFPAVVVATGHSARDVHAFLDSAGVVMTFKPFALGVRIEHAQALIDELQYGRWAGHPALGAASYRLVERVGGIGVFSFCMCPGGHMVAATTEAHAVVVNGWSPSSRRGQFANSGFVVEVNEATLRDAGLDPARPLDGFEYQRRLETRAFELGGGEFRAPGQRVSDLVAGKVSTDLPACSYARGLSSAPIHELLAQQIAPIREALVRIDARMPGFAGRDAVAVAVESRTSCPVRVERDADTLEAIGRAGLFPCGEGSGHAGGIMSAALDGIRVAERIERRFSRP